MSGERILVVEDESILAILIKRKLQKWGYEVVDWVDTGEDAVRVATETEPDLILMDIVLKGNMDGIEAAQQIHDSLDIPVIYLTAYSDGEVLKRARVTEPYGYIIKPFRESQVNANIEMALYKHKLENKKRDYIKRRVLADFYDLVQTSLDNYTDYSEEEIKDMLLQIFSQQINKDLQSFDEHLDKLGLNYGSDTKIIFDAYIDWLSDLLSSFGIRSNITSNEQGWYIEFLNCPWKNQTKNKPLFCLNCQAMINHSLNWTELGVKTGRNKTIAEGYPSCIFRLY